jgi:hypothetical protein
MQLLQPARTVRVKHAPSSAPEDGAEAAHLAKLTLSGGNEARARSSMRIHGRIWRLRELDEDSWEDLEIAGAR